MSSSPPGSSSHFQGKEVLQHVVEKRAQGMVEKHGVELPGYLAGGADALRECCLILALAFLVLAFFGTQSLLSVLSFVAIGLVLAKAGRGAWLAWSRLERLHRVLEQERYEIEHHRSQEREELKILYAAKGFEEPLLDQVVDVLMADGDRLLKVMLEEELGLTLEGYQHPLQQGLGAGVGALVAGLICVGAYAAFPLYGLPIAALTAMGAAAAFGARFEDNRLVPAFVWNFGIGALSLGIVFFAMRLLQTVAP